MHTPRRPLWLLMVLLLFTLPAAAAPGILKDFQGQFHSLKEYTGQGKWTVVMIWASDCSVCNQEAGQYVKFHAAHAGKDATMLGISLDGAAKQADAEAFIARHHINFPNLIDEPENVAGLYAALTGRTWVGTPTFLVFAPDGELRAAQAGAVPTRVIEDFMAREAAAKPPRS
jgi:peroxiredoxin